MNTATNSKLSSLFNFLNENRDYNKKVQSNSYNLFLAPFDSIEDKLYSVLHHIANTQSQPKIDILAPFFQKVYSNKSQLHSFKTFMNFLTDVESGVHNYESLYYGMLRQKGWGNKTSALFTKTIYHLHNGMYGFQNSIWGDAPKFIDKEEKIFLPVDAVIEAIFHRINPSTKWNFHKINKLLQDNYSSKEMEVWDDLWFWGFINQRGSGLTREFIWNEPKYWALIETTKDEASINKIKDISMRFLKIFDDK
ncbi:hypothetical protein QSE00_05520 [Arenibacter sp. M-2]|uniref:hypothetical protein n=1 Tax=Arenibacter sp. M-2 TaxID=3053612 RepID=UPI0025705D2D|nr:hypothetical protein [Arenibacter sp. M-2]MDL5511262.1 hypothetical protein [Arenibacter sp. M-2]